MLKKIEQPILKLVVLTMCTSLTPSTLAFAEATSGSQVAVTNIEGGTSPAQTTGPGVSVNISEFEFDSGKIIKYKGSNSNVVIPSTINGVLVTSIGENAFRDCSSLTSITIPNGITSIENWGFEGCKNLASIIIPDSVRIIGQGAFENCSSLVNIVIPDGVIDIGGSEFEGCKSLKSVVIPNSIKNIRRNAFLGCSSLESITIPNSVTSIEDWAFEGCSSLTSITIPDNVSTIGYGIVAECTNLESVTIPNSVTSIEKRAFENCQKAVFYVKSDETKQLLINYGIDQSKIILNGKPLTISTTNIKLNKTSLSLIKDNTAELTATIAPINATNKVVGWSSSDEKVAKVGSDGKVTALSAGTANITCAATDGSGKSAVCKVTVTNPVSVTSIKLGQTSLSVLAGKTAALTASAVPSSATNKVVTWSSSNEKIAKVDNAGKITGVAVGTANITCTSADGSNVKATCSVTVTDPGAVTGVRLNKTILSLVKNTTGELTATIAPINATNKIVRWSSSDEKVAKVGSDGKVTALSAGTANITCTATDGSGKSAVCKVTVTNPVSVTSIKLGQTSLSILAGKTAVLTASAVPSSATNKAVTWSSSNEKIAKVDNAGKITGIAVGTANIICTAADGSNVKATCSVTVTDPGAVTGVRLNKTILSLVKNTTGELTATIAPINATKKTVRWSSSDEKVAKVGSDGKVTALSAGTANITCTATDGSGKSAVCKVTVTNPVIVTSIKLGQTSLSILAGKTAVLTASAVPSSATNKAVTWRSSNEKIAKVDNAGKITGIAVGTANITCIAADGSNVKATCSVTVTDPGAVTGVRLNKTILSLVKNTTGELTATIAPINATKKTVRWSSSDEKVAKVGSDGKVTALSAGTANITCTATDGSGKSAVCKVTVTNPVSVTSIKLGQTSLSILAGKTAVLTASAVPSSATNKTVTWSSSNEKIAKVDNAGKVTGVAVGTANITCTAAEGSNVKVTCSVTVTDPGAVTGVRLNKTSLSLVKNTTGELTATIAPINATNKTVRWSSSDEKVAKVGSDGKVTALAAGTANITCTSTDGSGKSAVCKVTVTNPVSVTSIKLGKTSLSILAGKTAVLTASAVPSSASNKAVTWSSSNEKIAKVDNAGKVTGVAVGTANITCTAADGSNVKATCSVTVTDPGVVTGVRLNKISLSLVKDNSAELTATIAPINAANKAVRWSSSDEKVAKVGSDGKVTALSAGTANITCTATDGSGKSAVCKVTVTNPVSATSINLSKANVSVLQGKTTILTATVSPSNATNKAVTWSSSNTRVATIDSNGKVTGVAVGTAIITCRTTDGSQKMITCKIIVTK